MAILLTARNLGHRYGVRPLFDDVSFTLEDGDRVGLIGPNGAGKSTLLKIVAGALAPDQGDVARRERLRVGYLPQVPNFTEGATVRQAVAEGFVDAGGELGWEQEARVDELLARLELAGGGGGAERPVAQLSGRLGQAGGAGAGAGARPRVAAAGRADQPSGCGRDPLAGALPGRGPVRHPDRHPRPPVPAAGGDAHPGARPTQRRRAAGRPR
jgi:ATPase subunit of ABC transporter with duplicated ATPase domains